MDKLKFGKRASTPLAVGVTVLVVMFLLGATMFGIYLSIQKTSDNFADGRAIDEIYIKEARIKFYLEQKSIEAMRDTYNLTKWKFKCVREDVPTNSKEAPKICPLDENFYKEFKESYSFNLQTKLGVLSDPKNNEDKELKEIFEDFRARKINVECNAEFCGFKIDKNLLSSKTNSLKIIYPTTFDVKTTFEDAKTDSFDKIYNTIKDCDSHNLGDKVGIKNCVSGYLMFTDVAVNGYSWGNELTLQTKNSYLVKGENKLTYQKISFLL